jgi:NAD(P)-dependent dehydrogenase (short-subunit alcohol dehydrogenase family)
VAADVIDALRFDGRVAIVTGAGGRPSLGRAYARLLAERGARVVVNDLGVGPDGAGVHRAHADAVVAEIVAAGGEAVADTNTVATEEGAAAVVAMALDRWGRVDVLINNAGIAILASFDEITPADVRRSIDVHVLGTIWMTRAAWPHLKRSGHGRIVNVSSGAMLGERYTTIYGAAKGGIVGFTRSIAAEGADSRIKANAIVPGAHTTALIHLTADSPWKQTEMPKLKAEQVAPVVAYLAHEQCPVSGKCIGAAGGRVWEIYYAQTQGFTAPELTLEDVAANFDRALDRDGAVAILDPAEMPHAAWAPRPYQPVE